MLPRSGEALQQTIQYLTRAAQGGVRDVEPYIALSELNEIKRDIEQQKSTQATAGAPQTPQTPMVQSLPEQVQQSAGIAGLQAAKQKQAMGSMMQNAAQTPQPVPEGVPQPMSAAGGGLMSLPAGNTMNFRSGGIIAFAEPTKRNNNSLVTDGDDVPQADTDTDTDTDTAAINASNAAARARLIQLQNQIDARAKAKVPTATSDLETEMELAKKYPERFGILNTPAGQGQLERLDAQQKLARDEMGLRRQENKTQQLSLGDALIAGAEASRGQKGFGNIASMLMGAGKNAGQQLSGNLAREQAMRKEDLGLGEARMLAENKLQDLQRAKAEGDADKEAKARMELAKIEKDFGVSINTLLGKEYSSTMSYLGQTDAATLGAEGRKAAARLNASKPDKEKTLERLSTASVELTRLQPGTPAYAAKEAEVKALEKVVEKNRDIGPTRAALARESNLVKEDAKVQEGMKSFKYNPDYLDAQATGDEEKASALWNAELARLRGISRVPTPAAPAAPAAPVATPARPAPPAGFNPVR
jgi:hypothetical protein